MQIDDKCKEILSINYEITGVLYNDLTNLSESLPKVRDCLDFSVFKGQLDKIDKVSSLIDKLHTSNKLCKDVLKECNTSNHLFNEE